MFVQLMTNDCFHGARSAVSLLVDALRELPMPRKRQHAVHILSCYVRPAAIESLLEAVADQIRVTEVRILFDYSEVFAQGPMKLQKEFQEAAARLRHRHGITLEWRPIRPASGALVHAKAYGVAELNSQRTVEAGCLLFGSANATHRGLGLSHSNVELGSIATSRLAVERFFRLFQTLWEQDCEAPATGIEPIHLQVGSLGTSGAESAARRRFLELATAVGSLNHIDASNVSSMAAFLRTVADDRDTGILANCETEHRLEAKVLRGATVVTVNGTRLEPVVKEWPFVPHALVSHSRCEGALC